MELIAGNAPTEVNQVVLSFLGDEYLSSTVIDLGVHFIDKTKILNKNVDFVKYDDINEYTFIKNGFQTTFFDSEMMTKLTPVYDYSRSLSPTDPGPSDEDPEIQTCIDSLQNWIKTKYIELTGEDDIEVVCSRHLIMRIAGCDSTSCQIPGNPLMHLDYISFDAAYERQCLEQEKQPIPVVCPAIENLIDVVNIWFPSTEVNDWPLGFLDTDKVDIKDYVPIQIVSGSNASSLRYKPDLRVLYKNNMVPPEVHFFRSATKDSTKKGVIHGSFRITNEPIQRRSIELRCCIFKNRIGGTRKKRKNKNKTKRR